MEDDEAARANIAGILDAAGMSVEQTGDGPTGLNRAGSGAHDVVILDRMLPHLSGIDIVTRMRLAGIGAPLASGSWLPPLPDGSSLGARPAALHDRYVDLYQKFGESWRVDNSTTLFDYASGTSTEHFTLKSWPAENPPCNLPGRVPVKPLSQEVAIQECRLVRDERTRGNCVFDVMITGERGFAQTYLRTQDANAKAAAAKAKADAAK